MSNEEVNETVVARIGEDPFARLLKADVEVLGLGHAIARLTVRDEMLNFHGITHGGVVFALSDVAFGAASNSHGYKAVALSVDISFRRPTGTGDRLMAEAREVHAGGRTALYQIDVVNEETGELIARCQNLVYRTREPLVPGVPE